MRALYSVTIGCSSLLLFSVQPIMAKSLLPAFGGSAGVWVTCMLFFQVMLLAGYFYSWLTTNYLAPRAQSALHAVLLVLSIVVLATHPAAAHAESAAANPAWSILSILFASIGLPYFLLSTTSPLLQVWFAASSPIEFPWWMFALSNAASLAALLAYPTVIEPLLPQSVQMQLWTAGYGILVLLALAAAALHARSAAPASESASRDESLKTSPILWIALAACASTLWMAVANHLSREVAPVPFLWVLPLSVYLLTFILCFESVRWYKPALFRWLLPAAWLAAGIQIAGHGPAGLLAEVCVFSLALFVWCMFCHGEIARTRPVARRNTTLFYLAIAFGGALGAVFVGLAAPNILSTYLELPIGIAISALLALRVLYGMASNWRLLRLAVLALAAFVIASRFAAGFGDVVHLRNFYGTLQVSDSETVRTLYNGRTLHGVEFLAEDKSRQPTAYYGPQSGIGKLLEAAATAPRNVALVGLGAGALAAYGRAGDTFRFYELNPAVIDVAERDFRFLSSSAAKVQVFPGDGRLLLARERAGSFDVLVLDAFADDSIPVHLLTREAFGLYFRLLRPDGVMAIHITNRYLDLTPVVAAAAASLGKRAVEVSSPADPAEQVLAADWLLVAGPNAALAAHLGEPLAATNLRVWTDDYSNLFQVLK